MNNFEHKAVNWGGNWNLLVAELFCLQLYYLMKNWCYRYAELDVKKTARWSKKYCDYICIYLISQINFSCIFVTKYVNEAKPRYAPTTFLLGDILDVWLRGKRWNAKKKKMEKRKKDHSQHQNPFSGEERGIEWALEGQTDGEVTKKREANERKRLPFLPPHRGVAECETWQKGRRRGEKRRDEIRG